MLANLESYILLIEVFYDFYHEPNGQAADTEQKLAGKITRALTLITAYRKANRITQVGEFAQNLLDLNHYVMEIGDEVLKGVIDQLCSIKLEDKAKIDKIITRTKDTKEALMRTLEGMTLDELGKASGIKRRFNKCIQFTMLRTLLVSFLCS